MLKDTLEISVIIPAYNAGKTIAACIESVLAQRTNERFEIVVVDDGSTDDTANIAAQYPHVRVLRQQNTGAAAARNYGAREAQGWILCFIDADCVATPGWFDALVGAIRAGADGAKGTLLSDQPELVARFTQIEYEDRYDRMRGRSRIDFIDMATAAYRREVVLDVGEGGFDTRYSGVSVEDQEFSFRLAKKGCDLRFVQDATVYHRHPTTVRAYFRRKFNIARWKVLVHVRHPERVITDSHTTPGLKAQILSFWGIVLTLPLLPFKPGVTRLSALLIAAFVASSVPFIRKVLRKSDLSLAIWSIMMLPVRAASLGIGMFNGLVTFAPEILSGVRNRESGIGNRVENRLTSDSRSPTPIRNHASKLCR
jgi:glycosyltransferase involved in cell wall biosynthesis